MELRPLSSVAPKVTVLKQAAMQRAETLRCELPMRVETAVRNSVGAGAASIAANQISKHLIARGTVPAVIAGIAGAAAARTIVDGGFQVGENLYFHRKWTDHLPTALGDGARRGAINGGLTLMATPLQKKMATHFDELAPIKLAAATGAVRGTIGSAAFAAAEPDTWKHGVGKGVGHVALATVRGAVGGTASAVMSWKAETVLHSKFDKYIDFTSVGQTWFNKGGGSGGSGGSLLWNLITGHGGGGGVGGGIIAKP